MEGARKKREVRLVLSVFIGGSQLNRWLRAGLASFDAEKQDHQVDHEKQYDGHFQDKHPTVGLVVIEQLVQVKVSPTG